MRVAVTGASGLVGVNLVRALMSEGREVRALVHRARHGMEGATLVEGSVLDPASLARAFDGVDQVFHLAAIVSIGGETEQMMRVNIEGPRNVAAAARAAGARLVHMSSMVAFDLRDAPFVDETRPRPGRSHPSYDRSKAAGEEEVRRAIAEGLDAVIVNPTGIIGPGHAQATALNDTLLRLHRRSLPALVGGGADCVDARDVAAGAIAAGERGRTGENYLLTGHYLTMKELARRYGQAAGVPVPTFAAPIWSAHLGVPFAAAWARWTKRDPLFTHAALHTLKMTPDVRRTKAETELGYRPRPIDETLRDIAAWFREQGH